MKIVLNELDQLHAEAASGDWWVARVRPDWIMGYRDGMESIVATEVFKHEDAALIVALRNAYPALSARLKKLEAVAGQMRAFLQNWRAGQPPTMVRQIDKMIDEIDAALNEEATCKALALEVE